MHGNNFARTKAVDSLKAADIHNRNVISLPKTFSRSEIPVGNEQIPKPDILRRWSYLCEIASDIPEFKPGLQVSLLIGRNCPNALEPLKAIPVSGDGPFAMLLRHGWTVNGPTCFNPDTETVTCHRVVTWNTEVATEAISHTRVLELFDMDFEGCCVGKYSNAIMQSLWKEDLSKQLQSRDSDCTQLLTEHALGVPWITETDSFGFAVKMKEKPPTRRGVLSLVSSVYDPLGFLAPCMLPAKKILQELCREVAAGWGDPIPEWFLESFKKWMGQVPCLESLSITRCLKPEGFGTVISSQLHVFADASSTCYGSVAYLPLYDGNTAHCSFLRGKARFTPSKTSSIPRLELTAATVAVPIGRIIMAEV